MINNKTIITLHYILKRSVISSNKDNISIIQEIEIPIGIQTYLNEGYYINDIEVKL